MAERSPARATGAATPSLHTWWAAAAIIVALAAIGLAADQVAKHFAIELLPEGKPVQILGDVLIFQLVYNPGAAFSLGSGATWVFTIALAVVAIAILIVAWRIRSRGWAITLGFLLAGVLGNLTDRLFREPGFPVGHVVDYIFTPWLLPAIYNIADMFIVGSMIVVAILVLRGFNFDGTRELSAAKQRAADAAEADAAAHADNEAAAATAAAAEPDAGSGAGR